MLGKQRIHAGCWIDWDREGVVHGRQFYPLPARTFRILTYLVDHHDQVVAVSTLRQVRWPEPIPTAGGTFYPNADVYPHVHRIRWAIEPDLHHPKWLVTRRDRGYLLHIAPVASRGRSAMPEVGTNRQFGGKRTRIRRQFRAEMQSLGVLSLMGLGVCPV